MNKNWSGTLNDVQASKSKTGSSAHPTTKDGEIANEQSIPYLASSIGDI